VIDERLLLRGRGAAVFVAFMLAGSVPACRQSTPGANSKPPAVTVASPLVRKVTDHLDFTGNTAAINSVTLVARVEGYLEQIHFADGGRVKEGDLLFTIQQDQYEAQLKQAEAQVAGQKAALAHAETELGRYSSLVKQDAATQTQVDHWQYEKAAAAAALLGAEAQVELAKLNLSYTLVRAPFDGRIGRHLVAVGSLVGTMGKQTSLAVIDQIDPIYVYFTIDERALLRIIERRSTPPAGGLTAQTIPVYFGLVNEDDYPHEGRLDFAAIDVAPTTGTLQVRGIFPNPDHRVLPGLFVRVRVPALEQHDALLVPGDAVSFDQQGEYVLLVDAKGVAERRSIKTGSQVGNLLVVNEGLKPDDRVIIEGLLQAVPGRAVEAHPADLSAP
jgi:multidrug efflux system membrane fusion protein